MPPVDENETVTETPETTAPPAENKPDKTVVSEEVAALLKERDRREKEMRLKAEKQEKKLKEEMDVLRKQIDDLTGTGKKKDGDDAETLQARLEIMEKRAKQREDELNQAIERERKAREAAEEKERQAERVRLLMDALELVGVENKELGKRYFNSQVIWDEVDERWAFKMQDGKVVALKEGIELELPPELKPSKLRSGAGATGSTTAGKTSKQKELEQLDARISNLKKEIQQRGGSAPILLGRLDQEIQKRNLLQKELQKANK